MVDTGTTALKSIEKRWLPLVGSRTFCILCPRSFLPQLKQKNLPSCGGHIWTSCWEVFLSQLRVWSQRWRSKRNRFSSSFPASNSNQVLWHLTCVLLWNCLSSANTHVRPWASKIYFIPGFVTQSHLNPPFISSTLKIHNFSCCCCLNMKVENVSWHLIFFIWEETRNNFKVLAANFVLY